MEKTEAILKIAKSTFKKRLERPGHTWEDTIKIDFKEIIVNIIDLQFTPVKYFC